ncbi:F0F1 ATP synthase subunit epsilon [Pseudoclavibacter chungangensis]|uniref:F0F1 ATP synthase subunit epsilon n=1 Tax=Pseudoclavibacter chungangensis TaxID=587635 RepID=A0A7J5BSP3_9MICO|nr:F0F1 ATP synthase subunit epsilon [Pseudoclavibacter chungangensis]KAB1657313.1 F0F1 ATP synthase subunit epsilon [Pseudoclavibacter chungangensis]NYJ66235.1 F-type H+-transporting ATPase subunit epsilon [Pseudoclavibacter chungangensis]
MAGRANLTVSVVSAVAQVWEGEAKQVVARTSEGEIGVLPGHEPVLAVLGEGEVRVTTVDGELVRARADEGFLSVNNDVVTIVAREAALSSEA